MPLKADRRGAGLEQVQILVNQVQPQEAAVGAADLNHGWAKLGADHCFAFLIDDVGSDYFTESPLVFSTHGTFRISVFRVQPIQYFLLLFTC